MNDKDKEAFDYFWEYKCGVNSEDCGKDDIRIVWQAAFNYKQKEIDELKTQDQIIAKEIKTYMTIAENLKTENAKLRECVEFYAETTGWDNGKKSGEASYTRAREALKELDEKL